MFRRRPRDGFVLRRDDGFSRRWEESVPRRGDPEMFSRKREEKLRRDGYTKYMRDKEERPGLDLGYGEDKEERFEEGVLRTGSRDRGRKGGDLEFNEGGERCSEDRPRDGVAGEREERWKRGSERGMNRSTGRKKRE